MTQVTGAAARTLPNLDHLRWIAALMVVIQHTRGFVMVDYFPTSGFFAKGVYFVTGFAHQAVVIFFVLSGYLVGGKAISMIRKGSTSEDRRKFVIDRFLRIFVVLWPALLVTAIIAWVAPASAILTTDQWAIGVPDTIGSATWQSWLASALLLNEMTAPSISFDTPLWSLSYEWTYYAIAAAAIYVAARDRTRRGLLITGYAAAVALLCAVRLPVILFMMLLWIMGALVSQSPGWRRPVLSIGVFLLTLLLTRVGRAGDLAMGAATAILIGDRAFHERTAATRAGHHLAGFSFSLYAIHYPVLLLAIALLQTRGFIATRLQPSLATYALVLGLVAITYPVAWIFSLATEHRTGDLRRMILRRAVPAPLLVPTSPSSS